MFLKKFQRQFTKLQNMAEKFRLEKDSLGAVKVPSNAYYGAQTQRAIDNFKISGQKTAIELIRAYAIIKKAAAIANTADKRLDKKFSDAIVKAADEVLKGDFDDEFVLDIYQAEAGTSTNMNLNEVIANRANEILGEKIGSYAQINPNDHVNLSQSTNDTYPTAMYICTYLLIRDELIPALTHLQKSLEKKADEFKNIVKSGRTHLMDAVPIPLGQEFSGYASTIEKHILIIKNSAENLLEIPIGGTALGTGLNATQNYTTIAVKEISKETKAQFRSPKNFFSAMQNCGAAVQVSSSLKGVAIDLIKIATDIRLMNSGPVSGFGEITIPALQPGSSIMPGKVNPVIPGVVNMVCFDIIGRDTAITLAAQAGQFELNVMMPSIAANLISSIKTLSTACTSFAEKCVKGIKVNEKKCREYLERNPIIVTALTPHLGYEKAAEVAKRAYNSGKSIKEIELEMKLLDKKSIEKILDYKKLTQL